ncbi:MAG TPA: DNA-directed RNA polymerase subunit alpha C-terminal domain-containing protein [Lachnospiraceae bacterium]|nr:DNA-directed RNA polymerase subunit alpha C-terminal domain-containing protein [Lachnospiraceae bacterium]
MTQTIKQAIRDIDSMLGNTNIAMIKSEHQGKLKFPMYVNQQMLESNLTELELSVRSYNCLKRAGYSTIGELVEKINGMEDLKVIRNLGKKSAEEIMLVLMGYQFMNLSVDRKKKYVDRIKTLNGCE